MQQKKITLNVDYPKRLSNFVDKMPTLQKLFEVTKIDNKRQKTDTTGDLRSALTSTEFQPSERLILKESMDTDDLQGSWSEFA